MNRRALAPLGLLLGYGLGFAAAALGGSLLVFDDHPGQFFRLQHALTRGLAPWTWNPDWWMGFPELQFYPPGFVYLGAGLHYLTLAQLPPARVYQALVWLIYLAPGLTSFALLARYTPQPWFALPGAFVALCISLETMSGVEGGVRTGMIAARLGWALLPLLVLALAPWIEGDTRRRRPVAPLLAAPVLAAIVLCHPAHAPAAILYIFLAAIAGTGSRSARLLRAGGLILTAAALTAFWSLPLLAHLAEARGLAWGDSAWAILQRILLAGPLPPVLLVLAAAATCFRRDRVTAVLVGFPPLMLLLIALDRSSWLPANRLVDSLVLGVVLAAGLGVARVLEAATGRAGLPAWAAGILATLMLVVTSLPDARALALWPRPSAWPDRAEVERMLRLPELWTALRAAPPGRVLFVRSGAPLVAGTEWYRPHTHITALTPLYTGHPIVNGTFTHPSPIAALTYTGSSDPAPIRRLVEQLDGISLFGQPIEALDAGAFDRWTEFLGASTIVALEEDRARLQALETSERWARTEVPPFVLYESLAPVALPEAIGRDRWRVPLSGRAGAWMPARVAFSPLWRAEAGGRALPTRRGKLGDLEVKRPDIAAPVDLSYQAGAWEIAGITATAAGAVAWAAPLLWPGRRRRTGTLTTGSARRSLNPTRNHGEVGP